MENYSSEDAILGNWLYNVSDKVNKNEKQF